MWHAIKESNLHRLHKNMYERVITSWGMVWWDMSSLLSQEAYMMDDVTEDTKYEVLWCLLSATNRIFKYIAWNI